MFKIFGVALLALAVVLAVVPAFTDCQSQGRSLTTTAGTKVPMKCHWTGVAELTASIPLGLVGIMTTFSRRRTSFRGLAVFGLALGVMAILLPTKLIGVCATPTMLCHTVMSPVLIGTGAVVIAGSLGLLLVSRKATD